MNDNTLNRLLRELLGLSGEMEWLEFKCNYANPAEIGEYLSAIANAAAPHRKERGYIVWGVDAVARRGWVRCSNRARPSGAMRSWRTGWGGYCSPGWIFASTSSRTRASRW